MSAPKRVLLVIGGGIAAYKSLELIRRLRDGGVRVRVILTAAAEQFVTPLAVSALAGEKAYRSLFDLTDETEIGHIALARDTDAVVVAPATANLLAKMAAGIADDLASTALLATPAPILVAPAMNTRMWRHPATQANAAALAARGVQSVGPNSGFLAEGEHGPGRMAEPGEILAALETLRADATRLRGLRALVSAGPTHEPIDPVRVLANRSSGRQGYAIAAALAAMGAETTLVAGPTALPDPAGVRTVRVETAQEMLAACERALPADVAVMTAAVADWRVDAAANQKLKKRADGAPPALTLVPNPDILARLAQAGGRRPRLLIGFAAETENVVAHAEAKRAAKGCDWIVANDVSPATGVMGGTENTVHLVTAAGVEDWPKLDKREVAQRLAQRIAAALGRAA